MSAPAPMQISLSKAWAKPFVMKDEAAIENPTTTKTFEAVGEWLQKSLWATMAKQEIDRSVASPTTTGTTNGSPTSSAEGSRSRKGGMKLKEEDLAEDYYQLMNLDEAHAHLLSVDDLRLAYRKRCVEVHPDKMPDHSDTLFKKVQRGFEIFSNIDHRRAYDSSRPFDDAIPSASVSIEKYYTTFGPVFLRNVKWSLDQPMPSMGDDNTPMAEVKKFYDAWYRFRSWRDFSSVCELEDVNEDMERYHKRSVQKDNQRKLDGHLKGEMDRIRRMVDRCHDMDPRIIREREAAALEQERIKTEREAARNQKGEQRAKEKREAEDAAKKAASDKLNKAKNDKETLKELRLSLMAFFTENELLDSSPSNAMYDNEVCQKNINWLSQKSSADEIAALMADIVTKSTTADGDDKVEAVLFFNACIKTTEENIGQTRYGEAIKSTKQKAAEEAARLLAIEMALPMKQRQACNATWEDKEVVPLGKAAARYPEGTADRCKKMHAMLLDSKKFSDDQILLKAAAIEATWVGNPELKPTAPDMGFKGRLVRQLNKYCPEKVKMADAMLTKYAGKEEDFIQALVKKFGKEPVAEW